MWKGGAEFSTALFLDKAAQGRAIVRARKGRVLFSQGEVADAIFYVKSGQVKLTVMSEHGKEAVIGIFKQDEFFGEGCLIHQHRRWATATALTECSVMRVEKAAVLRVLADEPAFAQMFISHILTRQARLEEDLVDQLFNSSEKRLARLLLLLADFGKDGRTEPVAAAISQEVLAEMVGTTRSRVSHFMNKFRRLGFIDYDGHHLQIHSTLLGVVLNDAVGNSKPKR